MWYLWRCRFLPCVQVQSSNFLMMTLISASLSHDYAPSKISQMRFGCTSVIYESGKDVRRVFLGERHTKVSRRRRLMELIQQLGKTAEMCTQARFAPTELICSICSVPGESCTHKTEQTGSVSLFTLFLILYTQLLQSIVSNLYNTKQVSIYSLTCDIHRLTLTHARKLIT